MWSCLLHFVGQSNTIFVRVTSISCFARFSNNSQGGELPSSTVKRYLQPAVQRGTVIVRQRATRILPLKFPQTFILAGLMTAASHVLLGASELAVTICPPLSETYLLTPWCRVLLEKLTGLQLVKKFPAFHGTQRFITTFTNVRQLSLSWASPIQSIYPHRTSWRSILILSIHLLLGLPSGLFPSSFPTKTLYTPLSSPIRATCPAHLILLDFITRTILGEEYRSFSSSL